VPRTSAYLDQVTYRFLKESSVRVGALTSGQVQLIEGVPATDQDLITADPTLALTRQLTVRLVQAETLRDHLGLPATTRTTTF
jgi:ABC-type transport system substrate-binding protein